MKLIYRLGAIRRCEFKTVLQSFPLPDFAVAKLRYPDETDQETGLVGKRAPDGQENRLPR